MWTYTTDSMDFVTVSTGLILPYWMGLPIRYIHLYSLDDFSPRKSENIQKGYLQGRNGAVPVVNFKDIEW